MKVLVTPYPFGKFSKKPLELMSNKKLDVDLNPYNRKINPGEVEQLIGSYDIYIAGTETLSKEFYHNAKSLKLITRLGVGTDNINFDACRELGIQVSCTPSAPSYAVSEFTFAMILEGLKKISQADRRVRSNQWEKVFGSLLRNKTIGILGFGRVGKVLSEFLKPFNVNVLAFDISQDSTFELTHNVKFCGFEELMRESDIISVNLPLLSSTKGIINKNTLGLCQKNPLLVNTARGQVICEKDLMSALDIGIVSHAALDTFVDEPYNGPLATHQNVTLTCHMASSTRETRIDMEWEAAQNVLSFINSGETLNRVA